MSGNIEPNELKTKGKVLRCPNCGASDAEFDIDAGGLKCRNCRTIFSSPKINEYGGFEELVGEIRESGANNLRHDDYAMTLKCPSCGALVMLDKNTEEIHCHWCRHNLSSAEKVPNGKMPDLVLPFKVKRRDAFRAIKNFAAERKVLATSRFRLRLKEENLQAVYLPYVLVDVRIRVKVEGQGYVLEDGKGKNTEVDRELELRIDDLTVEASRDKLNQNSVINTNHIINSILPFDTENAVAWDPRYLKGFSCEVRDVNVENLKTRLDYQIADIAMEQVKTMVIDTMKTCSLDKWELKYVGRKWKTALFPVWLYSCRGPGFGKKRKIHYIAMNARTGELMGSVPIRKLFWNVVMFGPLVVAVILTSFGILHGMTWKQAAGWILVALIIFFVTSFIGNMRADDYTNKNARHDYKKDTKVTALNLKNNDSYVKKAIVTKHAEIYIYDENGKRLDIHPMAVMTQSTDGKKTFIEPERFYMYALVAIVGGIALLFLCLIIASVFGLI